MLTLRRTSVPLLTVLCLGLALATRGVTAQSSVIPPELMQRAIATGRVRVIVQLGGAGAGPEASLGSAGAVAAQRQRIASTQGAVAQALRPTGSRVVRQFTTIPYMAVEVGADGLRALDSMRGLVTGVGEERAYRPHLQQSAPLVGAPQAWSAGFDGSGMVVAIIDTGVESSHPFLAGKVVYEACFSTFNPDKPLVGMGDCPDGTDKQIGPGAAAPCDYGTHEPGRFDECSHGTHVAGIAAGNGGPPANVPRSGIARGASIMAIQVFSNVSAADPVFPVQVGDADILSALEQVLLKSQAPGGDHSFTVAAVNMSLGALKPDNTGFTAVCDNLTTALQAGKALVDNLRNAGIATVVSAGNDGFLDAVEAPACLSNVVSVGATNDGGPEGPPDFEGTAIPVDTIPDFSNRAGFLSLFAPGRWITSSTPVSDPNNEGGLPYQTIEGTSMSAPHVAGAFAVLKQANPNADVFTLLQALRVTGRPITFSGGTAPRIDVHAALDMFGPDLTVVSASTPAGAAPGTNVSVTYLLRNQGNAEAANFAVGFALVPVDSNGVPTGSDVSIGPSQTGLRVPGGQRVTPTAPVLIPGGTAPGLYRIRVIADVGNAVAEMDETNNTSLTGANLTIARADLAPLSVSFSPAVSAAGANISVTHTVRNLAPAPGNAPASLSRHFLGSTNTSVVGAIDLGVVSVPAINTGATTPVTKTVRIPSATPPGLYYVLVQVDDPNAIAEANETNNLGASAARIVIGPDLTVTAATTVPGAAPGTNVSVSYTVKNAGGQAASNFAVGFALVPVNGAGVPTGADVPLGPSRTAVTLAAGASATLSSLVLIPPGTAPGAYRIRVIADAGNAIAEADETNNTLLTAGSVNVVRPDLTPVSVTFTPATSAPGLNVSVTHTVRNLSPAPGNAPPSRSRLFLSSTNSSVLGAADLGQVSVPALNAGTSTAVPKLVTIPPATVPGLYYFLVQVDDGDAIVEPNEANNVGASAARIVIGPDLTVTTAATVTGASPGTNVSVSYTLKNLGGQAASNFAVGFTLVPGGDLGGASDVALGPSRTALTVGPGASASLSSPVLIPAGTPPGSYRIRVIADAGNVVAEADETNNTRLTTGNINVVRPDLTPVSVTFAPAASAPGLNVSVTHVVKNLAPVPGNAPASFSRLFLSSTNGSATGAIDLGLFPVPAINALATASVTKSVQIPPATRPGRYFFLVQVDDPNAIVEPSEDNNFRASAARIVIGPDLMVTAATTVAGASPGTNVSVNSMLRNLGGQAATGFTVGFALVPVDPSGAPNGADIPIGPSRTALTVGPGASASLSSPVLIPGGTAPGAYRIRVIADTDDAVAEADETDNTLLTAGKLNVVRPDLTPVSVTFAPAASAPGLNVSVTHVVKNLAPAPGNAPASFSRLFLSSTNRSVVGATDLGPVSVPVLNAGASVAVTKLVTIPPATPPGRYFFLVQMDDGNTIVEANASNDLAASAGRIVIGSDLTVTAASTTTGAVPGSNVSVSYTLKNLGGQAAANFAVGFTLVPSADLGGASDIPLSPDRTALTLAAGASASLSGLVLIPPATTQGAYRIRVIADAGNVIGEADETNNTLLTTGSLNVVRPDLTIQSVTVTPATTAAGLSVSVTHVVKNLGPAPGNAPASQTRLFLASTNSSVLGAADLGLVSVPALAAGTTASATRSVQIPLDTAPGVYYVVARADDGNVVMEQNEGNNTGASAAVLVNGPDLVVTTASVGTTLVAPGDALSVANTVRNQRLATSTPFLVGFYLSAGSLFDPGSDISLAPSRTIPGLLVNQESAANTSVTVPLSTPTGTYRVFVVADAGHAVAETDETNNVLATGTFTVAPRQTLTLDKAGNGAGSVTSTPAGIDCPATCAGTSAIFPFGAQVTLSAAAAPVTSTFTGWSGPGVSCPGTGTCTVTLNAATNVSATFVSQTLTVTKSGNGTGSVVSSPAGIDCGSACPSAAAGYATGSSVTVTATPDAGFGVTFTGCDSATNASCTVSMSSARAVTVAFASFALTVNKNGNGTGSVVSVPSGISCGSGCSSANASFASGAMVSVAAAGSPGSGFGGWTGCASTTGVSGSVCNVAMTSTKTISASFSTVTLTVQVSQTDASGAVQGNNPGAAATSAVIACGQGDKFPLTQCTSNNVPGTQLTLTATLGSGDFDGWTGCPTVSGTVANRCTVTLDGPQGVTVNASFSKSLAIHKNGCTPLTCSELDVMAAGTGTGTISDLPDGFFVYCGGVCSIIELPGTVQLLATPDPGSIFGGWSGCDSTNGNVCTITLPSDPTVVAITATFVATTPQARPPGTRPAPR